jgi:predicted ATP-grasp superfamily ATP-dependent carboligase
MAAHFHDTDGLVSALADASFDRPPALVANAHITGVSVARALSAHGVPVIALDRNGEGVAPPSTAVDFAGAVTYPLDDAAGFREDVERIVDAAGTEAVAFPCMDEWVRGFAGTTPDGVRLPFSDHEGIDRVLDKANLYALAEEHDVPYPETRDLTETDAEAAIDAVGGFPLVIKPARKRKFEEAFGTNVIEAADRAEFDETVSAAREADARVLVQEKVPVETGRDTSLASYVPPEDGASYAGVGRRTDGNGSGGDGSRGRGSGGNESGGNGSGGDASGDPLTASDALGVVGNAAVRFPQGFGTSCLVETVDRPAVAARALSILEETGYHGISEAEFVYDSDREEFVLLDINTRPWKWISMPVEAGANLPMAAYAAVTDVSYEPTSSAFAAAKWAFLPDYLELCASTPAFRDVLSRSEWARLVSGAFEEEQGFTTGVYRPSDPGPAAKVIETAFGGREYYCSC